MTTKEILLAEQDNNSSIVLYKEGIFWKAYEKSAYQFAREIKPAYKVKRKFIKAVQGDIVSVGFPSAGFDVPGYTIAEQTEERMQITGLPEIEEHNFQAWKRSIPYEQSSLPPTSNHMFSNELVLKLINDVRAYEMEGKTPVDCMVFLARIKGLAEAING